MDAEYSKGHRLFVVTQDGTLEGVFYSLDPGHNTLTLTEVVLHPSGKKLEGFSHYYRSEVIIIHIYGIQVHMQELAQKVRLLGTGT